VPKPSTGLGRGSHLRGRPPGKKMQKLKPRLLPMCDAALQHALAEHIRKNKLPADEEGVRIYMYIYACVKYTSYIITIVIAAAAADVRRRAPARAVGVRAEEQTAGR